MVFLSSIEDLTPIYRYHTRLDAPYFFETPFDIWKTSFTDDIDGDGRKLFRQLTTVGAYQDGDLIGYIQYGHTAFGFDAQGEISPDISYPVIRNLYFPPEQEEAGRLLLENALSVLGTEQVVYAFFHYFGMSCYARHGKLFEKHSHIEKLLKAHGFETEHTNVYYSSELPENAQSEVTLAPQDLTGGNQQYMDFFLSGQQVGGCEVHFVNETVAYLRWIYVNGPMTKQGIGTKCMRALQQWLRAKGCTRLDTDTADSNEIAQHFYEKTGFYREGITRSFYRK